jgi:hypothetical protein
VTTVAVKPSFSPDMTRDRVWHIGREAGIIGIAVFLYFYVRGLVDAKRNIAIAHSIDIMDVEKALGIFHESALQDQVMERSWMVAVFNWIYIYGHWPVVIGTLVWLVWRHPAEYGRYRNAMLLSGAVGLIIFATYPVAPPRFLPGLGFWDSVTAESSSYRVLQPPSLTNPYAAMPSLHFGWNLLMGVAWIRLARFPLGKIFGWVMPPLMFAAIVLTANPYFLDGIAGGSLAVLGLLVASRLHQRELAPPGMVRNAMTRSLPLFHSMYHRDEAQRTLRRSDQHREVAQESHGVATCPPAPASTTGYRASRGESRHLREEGL